MEIDSSSYSEILSNLKSRSGKRDPRSIRLAAVTSAMMDVVLSNNGNSNNNNKTPDDIENETTTSDTLMATMVYAATVSALERTFQKETTTTSSTDATTAAAAFDSVATQMALLELLQVTIPFVSSATLTATLNVTSKVLRALVTLAQSVLDEQDEDEADGRQAKKKNKSKQQKKGTMMETKDELGGMNSLLRATIRASTILLQHLSSDHSVTSLTKTIQQLCHTTILQFLEDRHAKIRKVAQSSITELLLLQAPSSSSCPIAIRQQVLRLVTSQLEQAKASSSSATTELNDDTTRQLHFLAFLQHTILHLGDMAMVSTTIGSALMEWLMNLLRNSNDEDNNTMSDYVSGSQRDATPRILLLKALLSTLLALLEDSHSQQENDEDEDDNDDEKDDKKSSASALALNEFAARVLASLLQGHPLLVFSFGLTDDVDLIVAARVLYAQVVMASCSRVMMLPSKNPTLGLQLLPLAVQMMVQLSRPSFYHELAVDPQAIAAVIMPELSKLFRIHLSPTTAIIATAPSTKHVTASIVAMKQVLHVAYQPTWSVSLKALVVLLQLFPTHDEVPVCVEALLQLHDVTTSGDHEALQAIEQAVASLIEGVGLETFWNWVSWSPTKSITSDPEKGSSASTKKQQQKQQSQPTTTGGIAMNRAWLLPVMKSASSVTRTHRLHLAFFQTQVLGLARRCDALAVKHPKENHMARVVDLWSLLACFCQHPVDIETALPTLAQTLVRAISDVRYPQLVPIISGGLATLFAGVAQRVSSGDHPDTKRDAKVLTQISNSVLPALFKAVETLSGSADNTTPKNKKESDMDIDDDMELNEKAASPDSQAVESVANAIAEVSKQAPRPFLQNLFRKLMQRLLEATQAETRETEKICSLLSLARALVASESMDEASISLLYRALKPLIRSDENEPRVQKRAYRVLFEISQRNKAFVTSSERLDELSELLVGSIMTCQVSARHMRIKCMIEIVKGMDSSNQSHMDVIAKSVGEVLLCLKDANGKSREASYQLLLAMATAHADMEAFFRLLIAALAAQTTHLRSAAVTAMSRLVFEFARTDPSVQALLPALLRTILVLFDDNSREVTKSTVGFVRVCVAALPADQLEPMLPELVGGLLKNNKGKDRFRSKIKIILKKLVRLYGYDTLMPLIPSSDSRLLTHMRKLSERALRQKAAKQVDHGGDQTNFDGMIDSDEDDSDDGRTLTSGATGFSRMTGRSGKSVPSAAMSQGDSRKSPSTVVSGKSTKSQKPVPLLRAESNGEVLDMLSSSVSKSVRFAVDDEDSADSDEDDGMMEFDDTGRLIVPDDSAKSKSSADVVDGNEDEQEFIPASKKRKSNAAETKAKSHRRPNAAKGLGAAYKSKKAGGDVKKKGQKYEPYAFIPLDGKRYTKKNRRKAVEEMSTVVRSGAKRKRN